MYQDNLWDMDLDTTLTYAFIFTFTFTLRGPEISDLTEPDLQRKLKEMKRIVILVTLKKKPMECKMRNNTYIYVFM